MNSKRQPSIETEPREGAEQVAPASGEMVRLRDDDPLVRALLEGSERESAPANEQPRELSPESLALLLDRLDGIVDDADPPQGKRSWALGAAGRSGVVPRARIGRMPLRGWLTVSALMLATALVLLWPAAEPRQPGHVVGHSSDDGVRTVDLPAAPEPPARPSTDPENPAADGVVPGTTPSAEVQTARPRGRVRVSTSSPAEVRLGGRTVGKVPGSLKLPAGRHHLLFRTAAGVSFYRTVRVRGGETVDLQIP